MLVGGTQELHYKYRQAQIETQSCSQKHLRSDQTEEEPCQSWRTHLATLRICHDDGWQAYIRISDGPEGKERADSQLTCIMSLIGASIVSAIRHLC